MRAHFPWSRASRYRHPPSWQEGSVSCVANQLHGQNPLLPILILHLFGEMSIALQLKLETESMREVSVADGRSKNVPYVGPVRVSFGKRFCYVGALVLGDEVLLGAVPMEDMDLVVSPSRREITPDPASPNIPHARVKSLTIA